jgi:hypothetical protein
MKATPKQIADAEEHWCLGTNEVELAEDPQVSVADDSSGYWIEAWLWMDTQQEAPDEPAKLPEPIPASKLTNMGMVAGYENEYSVVIDDDRVMEWVGIGWIDLRKATDADRKQYPAVLR